MKAQAAGLAQVASTQEIDSSTWQTLRELETGSHTSLRISSLPQRIVGSAARILADDVSGVYTSIDPRRGVIRVVAGAADGADSSPEIAAGMERTESSELVFEKLPPELWSVVSPSVVADPLSQGIKRAYDPHNILNPGILGNLNCPRYQSFLHLAILYRPIRCRAVRCPELHSRQRSRASMRVCIADSVCRPVRLI